MIDHMGISRLTCRGCSRKSFITDNTLKYTVVVKHTNTRFMITDGEENTQQANAQMGVLVQTV